MRYALAYVIKSLPDGFVKSVHYDLNERKTLKSMVHNDWSLSLRFVIFDKKTNQIAFHMDINNHGLYHQKLKSTDLYDMQIYVNNLNYMDTYTEMVYDYANS